MTDKKNISKVTGWGKFPHPSPADLVKAQELVNQTRAEIQAQQPVKKPGVLMVAGHQYEIVKTRFQTRKTVHTADELYHDQQLLEHLVKIGSTVIRKIA
ncbi:MAG: hypothetical protein H7A09_10685 [Oceanospirillaceae bacterium]|nr:hypothetical protein [Chitinophagales bacterium]MCP5326774.1 hypothetical protein [Oceanospirillaceae bacterium]